MTLLDVVDAARALLNEPLNSARTFPDNTSSFWTDGQLTTYHNLVQQEVQQTIIQADEDFFVTQTFLGISSNQSDYSLPSTFIKMRLVEDARNSSAPIEIYPVAMNQRGMLAPGSFRQNSSDYRGGAYYLRGAQIVLTDTPTFTNASAIRLNYIYRLTDITASSATSEIPAEHHRLLVWGVVRLALFQQQADTSLADREFEKHMSRLRQEIESRQTQRARRVAVAATSRGD